MDEEKASGVVIRTSLDTADKQCACLIFISFHTYILRSWKTVFGKGLIRPFKLFIYEPIVQLLGLYMAFVYGLLYLFITTIPSIFQDVYHERVGIAGLHYLALGVGLTCGSQINARFMDRVYKSLKSRNGGVGRPEFRLRL